MTVQEAPVNDAISGKSEGWSFNPYRMYKQGLMSFWYWYVRRLNTAFPYKMVEGRKFKVSPGVYKPLENEHSAAEYCREGDTVLDIGCGCGVGAIFAAEKASHVLATDISQQAVEDTIDNCKALNVTNIKTILSDMFEKVEGKYDIVIANPPYIKADFDNEQSQFATSTRYLPLLFAGIDDHLKEDGRLLIQYPGWFGPQLKSLAENHGFECKEVKRMPMKSVGLFLLSMAYLQVGFRSTHYLFERKK